MAQYTNTLQLPPAFVKAVVADPYSAGKADISVTSLIGPAQLRTLRLRHDERVVEDVSDRVWSLLGQLCHALLERSAGWQNPSEALGDIYDIILSAASPAAKVEEIKELLASHRIDTPDIIERRLYAQIEGWTISGQIDMLRDDDSAGWGIGDWKLTSVWTWIYGGRLEWEDQLNSYAWLARKNGLSPRWLKIYTIFRDWREMETQSNPAYPPKPIMVMNLPLWADDKTELFLRERVRIHQLAGGLPDHSLPPCSEHERWAKPATWAVMKAGGSRAARVLSSAADAEQWLADLGATPGEGGTWSIVGPKGRRDEYSIVHRPGDSVRCARYCPVAQFCHQRQAELRTYNDGGKVVRGIG